MKALDTALNALDETRGQLEAALAHRRFRSGRARSASRSGCSRCARRRASTMSRSMTSRRCARKYNADIALIDAGEDKLKALEAAADAGRRRLSARPPMLCPSARQGRVCARQGGQCRAQAAQARSREVLHPARQRSGGRRTERHRPRSNSGYRPTRGRGRAADEASPPAASLRAFCWR